MKKLLCLILACLLVCFAGCGKNQTAEKEKPHVSSTQSVNSESSNTSSTEQEYIEVMREGILDKIPVTTVKGKVPDYTIAINHEYFTLQSVEMVDIFNYDAWN